MTGIGSFLPTRRHRINDFAHIVAISSILIIIIVAYYTFEYDSSIILEHFPWFRTLMIFEFTKYMNGMLLYIVFAYAAIVFWWRGALIVWLISMIITMPHVVSFSVSTQSLISNILFLVVPLMVMVFIVLQLKWRARERETLAAKEAERQAYMSQSFKVQEEERQRIARELHDDTTQRLWVVANRAQNLVSDELRTTIPIVTTELESISGDIFHISNDVRRLSLALRPSILDDLGLVPAIRWLVDQSNAKDFVTAGLVVRGDERKLPVEVEIHIFRIVQEALSNVRRHSNANEAKITLEFEPNNCNITIIDNGRGFCLSSKISDFTSAGRLGLTGIQQRSRLLNGVFNIQSEVGQGTIISLDVPV